MRNKQFFLSSILTLALTACSNDAVILLPGTLPLDEQALPPSEQVSALGLQTQLSGMKAPLQGRVWGLFKRSHEKPQREAITNAWMQAKHQTTGQLYRGLINHSGEYAFEEALPNGVYEIMIYFTLKHGEYLTDYRHSFHELTVQQGIPSQSDWQVETAALSGQVTLEGLDDHYGIALSISDETPDPYQPQNSSNGYFTNAQGHYTLFNLSLAFAQPDQFKLHFWAPFYQTQALELTRLPLVPGETRDLNQNVVLKPILPLDIHGFGQIWGQSPLPGADEKAPRFRQQASPFYTQGGYQNGNLNQVEFNRPGDLVRDSHGNYFLADTANHCIRKISPDGQVSTFAGSSESGWQDGPRDQARFAAPTGLAIDAQDQLYVADTWNHRIRKITPEGEVTTLAGSGSYGYYRPQVSKDGPALQAQLNGPQDLTLSPEGVIYIADTDSSLIRKLENGQLTTLAGGPHSLPPSGQDLDGQGTEALIINPTHIVWGPDGNLYISEPFAGRVRQITPAGDVRLFAGQWNSTALTQGSHRLSLGLGDVRGLAFDAEQNLYLSSQQALLKITPDGETHLLHHHTRWAQAAQKPHHPGALWADEKGLWVSDIRTHRIYLMPF